MSHHPDEMDEPDNRPPNWLERTAFGRRALAVKDGWERIYYAHLDRYCQASQGLYRFWTWIVITVVLTLFLAGSLWIGIPCYRHIKEKHAQKEAIAFVERGDYRNAWLSANQALTLNPSNVDACRVMARIADQARSPEVLDWQRKIVAAAPSVENKLVLAAAGLRYQKPPFPLASQILNDLQSVGSTNITYQMVAASRALGLHQLAEAEGYFETAVKLDPTNQLNVLNLAVFRLGTTNEAKRIAARATLSELCADETARPDALRALIADRLAQKDLEGAGKFSTQLLATPRVSLEDQLQNLSIARHLHAADFNDRLHAVQKQALTNAPAVAQISDWMKANGLLNESFTWLTGLPEVLRSQRPLQLALADVYLERHDWNGLRDFASNGNWGDFEYIRFALVSHACAELGMSGIADSNWGAAVTEADNSREGLERLLNLAENWNLKAERQDLLERIVKRFPSEHRAEQALAQIYFTTGNTAALNQLSDRMLSLYPTNANFQNNLAATALLLRTNLTRAYKLAAEAYSNAPGNPDETSTYAFALHLQGRDQEGISLLEKLAPAQLNQPSVALYYGVLLTAVGKTNKAAEWLQMAETSHQLLPEEKQLLTSVKDRFKGQP